MFCLWKEIGILQSRYCYYRLKFYYEIKNMCPWNGDFLSNLIFCINKNDHSIKLLSWPRTNKKNSNIRIAPKITNNFLFQFVDGWCWRMYILLLNGWSNWRRNCTVSHHIPASVSSSPWRSTPRYRQTAFSYPTIMIHILIASPL